MAADKIMLLLRENERYEKNRAVKFLRLLAEFREEILIGAYYIPTKEETKKFYMLKSIFHDLQGATNIIGSEGCVMQTQKMQTIFSTLERIFGNKAYRGSFFR